MIKIDWYKIEEEAKNNLQELIFKSELRLSEQIDRMAEDVILKKNIKIIMVAGPSSSGKTTFSNRLKESLQNKGIMTYYIGLDDFFLDRDTLPKLPSGLLDLDSLSALDVDLVNKTIDGIMQNKAVDIPSFDFVSGKRLTNQKQIKPNELDVVIIEGIHALNPIFIKEEYADHIYKIGIRPQKTFIMPSGIKLEPEDLRLLRRTIRDVNTRGYSYEHTAKQWREVCNAEKKYITPYMDSVDCSIDSAIEYELFIYKKCLKDSFKDCKIPEFSKLVSAIKEVSEIPNVDILDKSIINEFAFV